MKVNPLYPKLYSLSYPTLAPLRMEEYERKWRVPENKHKQLLTTEVGGCRNKGRAIKKQWLSDKTQF